MPTVKQIRYDPTNDLYKILGVPSSATIEDIHRAYRSRAKEVHPDLNPERAEWANAQFQGLNTAHDILGNLTKRIDYDQKRRLYYDSKSSTVHSSQLAQASRAAWNRRNRRRPQWYWLFQGSLGLICVGSVFLMIHSGPNPDQAAAQPVNEVSTTVPSLNLQSATASLTACPDPNVTIIEPADGAIVEAPFRIKGTSAGKYFASYTVTVRDAYLAGDVQGNNYDWTELESSSSPVEQKFLVAESHMNYFDRAYGDYVLRLTAQYDDGNSTSASSCEIEFQVIGSHRLNIQNTTQ